ncbi:MAG: hypothetical protein ACE5FH_08385 [Candidatus Zixiibacteriota bacterium]
MITATTRPESKAGFHIEVGCPGCGGRLEVGEGFFVTRCVHCDSVLRIVRPNGITAWLIRSRQSKRELRFSLDRWLKEHDQPLSESELHIKALYYPYWKVDGHLLKIRNKVVEEVVVEGTENRSEVTIRSKKRDVWLSPYCVTVPAGVSLPGVPKTLGMRTDYMKLMPLSSEHVQDGFDVMPVMRQWSEVDQDVRLAVGTVANIDLAGYGQNKTELIYPTYSAVYAPYYIIETYGDGSYRRFLLSGISGKVLSSSEVGGTTAVSPRSFSDDVPIVEFGSLEVIFHRCSTCGADLEPKQSYIYVCHNCDELNNIEPGNIDLACMEVVSGDHGTSERLFPFWSFPLPEDGSIDLRRMFGGVHECSRLVVPAFHLRNLEAAYRLAKRISLAASGFDLEPVISIDQRYHSVDRSVSEAIGLANVIIYRESVDERVAKSVGDLVFQPDAATLFYAPFTRQSYFYVDSSLEAITFEKSLLEL